MTDHPDWQSAHRELVDDLSGKADSSDLETLRTDVQLAGEALQRIRGMLSDIIRAAEIDRNDYQEDLDRLQTIGGLIG